MHDSLRSASDLAPVIFSLGDPDLVVELLASNPAGVVLVEASAELPVVYCNASFERWAPHGSPRIVGRSLPDLFAWTDRAGVRAAYREVIRTGLPLHWRSAPYHRRGGAADQPVHWSVSHFPLRTAGRITHVLSFVVDVSDEAGGRARVQEAQGRVLGAIAGMGRHLTAGSGLRSFVEVLCATIADLVCAARVAFWRYDVTAQTISPHPGAYGLGDEEMALARDVPCRPGGRSRSERVVFRDLEVREELSPGDAERGPDRHVLDVMGVHDLISVPWKAGDRRLGALSAYDSTRPSGFAQEDVWVLQAGAAVAGLVWDHGQADDDLAEQRRHEAARLQHRIDESVQMERLKADFLKLASHELRGPLGIVRGYISMMEDGSLGAVGENVAPVLPLLRTKLDEMNQLIGEMLETARLDDSALQLRLEALDLTEIVREAVRGLEPLAAERHRLVTSMPAQPVVVRADASRLRMVVTNLVHNAIKYSPAGGEVRIRCEVRAGVARLGVTDEGVGISPADRSRLFTRFGRILTGSTADIPGTGLGLYLARDLARRQGGEIEVESEVGRGSTFTLSLPTL